MKNLLPLKSYLEKHGFEAFESKAVLFDMDGVIYDSMPNHARSWHEAMASFGLDMPPEGAYEHEGRRGVDTIKLLARQQWGRELDDEEALRMYAVKSQTFAQCPPPKKMEGITSLFQQIKQMGMQICVVTGSGQHTLLDKLTRDFEGLLRRDLIVTAYDVKRGKPNPDPYLAGMRKTQTLPHQTIVIENAPLGVQAGVAASCFTIAVNTGPLPDSMLAEAGADLIMPSIVELSRRWGEIVRLLR